MHVALSAHETSDGFLLSPFLPYSFFPFSYCSCTLPIVPVSRTRADMNGHLGQPSCRSPPTFRAGESSHISPYESSDSVGSALVDPHSRAETTAQLGREEGSPQPEQPRGICQNDGLIRSAAEVARAHHRVDILEISGES